MTDNDTVRVPRSVLLMLVEMAERATVDAEQAIYQGKRLVSLLLEYSDEVDRLNQKIREYELEYGEGD